MTDDNDSKNVSIASGQASVAERAKMVLELEQLKKRREQFEYMAHAHAVEGQELPAIIEDAYTKLQSSISKIQADLAKDK